jgi:hypothetical protein
MARRLSGTITVFGTDAEDFGSDEHPSDNNRPVNLLMVPDQGPIQIGVPPVKWGGECRVEIDFGAELLAPQDNVIRITGQARFFEGASEDTSELEDARPFNFHVPRTTAGAPATSFSVPLRNSTVIGAEDHAEVVFSLSNFVAEVD